MSRDINGLEAVIMQLGKSLLGAIIGAALGIGVLIGVYVLFGIDAVWLAVVVALITGMGVRTMVSTSGHASYARGALTGVLALAAYVGGWFLVAEVAKARAAAAPKRAPIAATQDTEEGTEKAAAPDADAPPVEQPRPINRAPTGAAGPKAVPPGQNPMDYIWLGIAALVAYELGRGTGAKPAEMAATETAKSTHPDA
ncbi:MAG: hypothetical protein WD738_07055 [Pirellulales bacterium]